MFVTSIVVLLLLALILLFQAIRDVIRRKRPTYLILLLILFPLVGPLIYFQIGSRITS